MAFPTGWTSRAAIVVQHGQVTADQTGFPVLLTADCFATNCPEILTTGSAHPAQSDGGDLRFSTDSAGAVQIACDVANWTQNATFASATAEIWVPRDILTGSDVTIYVWWEGGGGLSQPAAGASFGSQAVWDANYCAVYHLDTIGARTTGTSPDSTSNGNTVTNQGASNVTVAAGAFSTGGNGGSFAGDNYWLNKTTTSGLPTGSTTYTLEGWFKKTASTNTMEFFGWGANGGSGQRSAVFWDNTGTLRNELRSFSVSFPWTADTSWHHVVFTLPSGSTGNDVLGYLDGVSKTMTGSGSSISIASPTMVISGIAGAPGNLGFFGLLDEIRISKIARSSSWIATQYNNMSSPGTFAISGARVAVGTTPNLFRVGGPLSGLGVGGPFFTNPLN